ncbi:hypothetical protein EON65_19570 [archaeon]|nr:MAG: hypothetical protein EON65_19570 [archaeon]
MINPISNDTTWRIDIEIVGTYNVFKWVASNDVKYSTGGFKPVQQEGAENSYIFGFNGLFLRSNYVELDSETINGLCNATVAITLFTINEGAASAAPAKGKKGANDLVIPAEEILVLLSIPMSNLFTAQGNSITVEQPIDQYTSANSVVLAGPVHTSVVPSGTVFALRAFTDNELSAYTLGSKVVRWQGALLTSPPPAWSLHAADVVDPKAKVQPTAADLRAKYFENIIKLVETQTKVASYTCEIGSINQTRPEEQAGEGEENSVSDYVLRTFTPLTLTEGRVQFDSDKARAVPAEEDIRVNTDTWSISWKTSDCFFLHRSVAKKLVSMISSDPSHSYLPLTIKKTPFPEFTSAEGGEVFATGLVDISPIISPGKAVIELHVGSLVGDQMEECNTHLTLSFTSNEPLRPVSELSKLASAPATASMLKPKVPLAADNKDALQELRDEISKAIEYIAQEYVSQYPAATNSDQAEEEKKTAFLQYLLASGIFHDLQEKIRPRVVSLIADKYGVRGRALGKSELVMQMDIEQDANYKTQLQNILSELYVFLLKECNVVLNSMFTQTMIQKQRNEVTNPARLDDEEESDLQKLYRLYRQATDRAADGRDAEDLHLERLQLIDHNLALYNDKQLVHDVYLQYAHFLLAQATKDFEQYLVYLKKAREVLLVAMRQVPVWSTLLLYACILVECDQAESAEQTLHTLLNNQLTGYSLGAFDDMSGYDTDGLCPVPPRVYCVLASLFAMQKKSLLCNKALRLANR